MQHFFELYRKWEKIKISKHTILRIKSSFVIIFLHMLRNISFPTILLQSLFYCNLLNFFCLHNRENLHLYFPNRTEVFTNEEDTHIHLPEFSFEHALHSKCYFKIFFNLHFFIASMNSIDFGEIGKILKWFFGWQKIEHVFMNSIEFLRNYTCSDSRVIR